MGSSTFRDQKSAKSGPRQWLLLPLAALCLTGVAHALDPTRTLSQYIHDKWSPENGFPGGQVNSFAQTRDGYLWIGTENGLVRFDGFNFVVIRQPSTATLPITHVLGLATDEDGNLWVRVQGPYLLRYRDGEFVSMLADGGTPYVGVTAMTVGRDGGILASTLVQGTIEYRHGKPEPLTSTPPSPTSMVISLAKTSDGKVWMGTRDHGLFYLDQGRIVSVKNGLPDEKINCMSPTEGGRLWIGTDAGLTRWNGIGLASSGLPASLNHVQILTMTEDRDANVWVGTARGLFRINGDSASIEEPIGNGTTDAITALFEDREGNLWVGSAQGLERIRDSAFVTYSTPAQPPPASNGPIYGGSDGCTWFAPTEGGVYCLRNGNVEQMPIAGLTGDVVYSIDGNKSDIWLGRQKGGLTHVFTGSGIHVETYTRRDGLAQNSVYALHVDRDGAVWAGTLSGGVSRFKDGQFKTYTMANGLASNTVASIEQDSDGAMWFATPRGLSELANGRWKTYTRQDGLPSDNVFAILNDGSGGLWIGTENGLAVFYSNRIRSIGGESQALREPVFGLARDRVGSLWFATSKHVLRASREGLLGGQPEGSYIREYGIDDGLRATQGVRRDRSVVSDDHGRIWFSLGRGISVVDPARVKADSAAPALAHVVDLVANGTSVELQEPLHLPASQRRLVIDYAGLSLSNPDRVQFRYRLDGFDHAWNEPGTLRQAVYTNLAPGPYLFHLVASNSDGMWNGQEVTLPFTIAPALWQTWWFQCSCLMAAAVAVWSLYRLRMHGITKQLNVRFEERLNERTRIAQELHDTLLQGVLSATMQLRVATRHVPEDSPAKPQLSRVVQLMGEIVEEGRSALGGLRSSNRLCQDLEEAFSRLPQELAIPEHIQYRVVVDGPHRALIPAIRDEVYRIIREASINAFRHSQGTEIKVEIEYAAARLQIVVRDNGRGIDPDVLRAGRDGHWGLPGMRERAERIGAMFKVWSRVGSGTEVELAIPGNIAYERRPSTDFLTRLTSRFSRHLRVGGVKGGNDQ